MLVEELALFKRHHTLKDYGHIERKSLSKQLTERHLNFGTAEMMYFKEIICVLITTENTKLFKIINSIVVFVSCLLMVQTLDIH